MLQSNRVPFRVTGAWVSLSQKYCEGSARGRPRRDVRRRAGRPPLRQLSLGRVCVRWPRSAPSRPVVRALSPASGSPRTAAATHIPSGTAHTAGRNDGTRRRGADGVHSAVITDGHRG